MSEPRTLYVLKEGHEDHPPIWWSCMEPAKVADLDLEAAWDAFLAEEGAALSTTRLSVEAALRAALGGTE